MGALGFGALEPAAAASSAAVQACRDATETRNTCPYCSVACGIIMYSLGDQREERARRGHAYRGRSRSSDQPRHALPARARRCSTSCTSETAHQISAISRARLRPVRARVVGRRARPHRPADEGRPRQELRRQERATASRSIAGSRTGFLGASATTNETAYCTYKVVRSTGMP